MSSRKYEIRTATIIELEECIKLFNAHSDEMNKYSKGAEKATAEKIIQILISEEDYETLLISNKTYLFGFALLSYRQYDMFIDKLYINNQFRSQGVGKALIEYIKKKAKQMNLIEINVICFTNNQRAIEFYKKNGFRKASEYERTIRLKYQGE